MNTLKQLTKGKKTAIGIIVIIIVLVSLFFLSQTPTIVSVTVSPEVIVKGQSTEVTVRVVVRPFLLAPNSLSVVMTERGYNNGPKTDAEWFKDYLKYYSSYQLNPVNLGSLAKQGKDSHGNIIYSGRFSINKDIAQTVMLSIKSFGKTLGSARLVISTRPATLPPDPGEAGKATLEGIDSDHDGLRDDVQREVFFLAPDSERLRMGLTQLAKPLQSLASLQNLSDSAISSLLNQFADGNACFNALIGQVAGVPDSDKFINYQYANSPNYLPEVNKGMADGDLISKLIINTTARTKLNEQNYHLGFSGDGSNIKLCTFNPFDSQD